TMPSSRATARSDRLDAPSAASCRRAARLISSLISARTRARRDDAFVVSAMVTVCHKIESTALDTQHSSPPPFGEQCSHNRSVEDIRARHVMVGAGPIGPATAEHLVTDGHRVRVITRSGSGSDLVERVAADASDAERLTELTRGAAAIYNCANPPY